MSVCTKCGKDGTTVSMSVTGSGKEPTPPICMKCFSEALAEVKKGSRHV